MQLVHDSDPSTKIIVISNSDQDQYQSLQNSTGAFMYLILLVCLMCVCYCCVYLTTIMIIWHKPQKDTQRNEDDLDRLL